VCDHRPGERDRGECDQHGGEEFCGQCFAHQSVPFVQRLADLYGKPAGPANCRDPQWLPLVDRIEEEGALLGLQRRRQRQVRHSGNQLPRRIADLKDERVLVVVQQCLLLLRQHVELRPVGAETDVFRHV